MVLLHHPEEGFFASHLPLYYTPHDYQVIYKIHIAESEKLIELVNRNMVTLLPSTFDLTRLLRGERFAIETQFFDGHFERGGTKQFTAKMTFEQPILIKQVSPQSTSTKAMIYLAAINDKTAVFAHKIQTSPSFDAVGFLSTTAPVSRDTVLTCDKPTLLNAKVISSALKACQPFDVKYIETQDFK